MASRRILYFCAAGHSLYRRERGGLQLLQQFAPDDGGLNDFRECFKRCGRVLLQVVADLDGEDFHEDQIPYLRGAERCAVIDRRIAQRYRDTRLAAALSLGFAADERRSERLLLASFSDAQPLTAWLDALEGTKVRLAGVYSTALVAPALAAQLDRLKGERLVLMTANRAGLRQSFIEHGRLRFSRLVSTREPSTGLTALLVRTETERMLKYLDTVRATASGGSPMRVLLVVPESERSHCARTLAGGAGLAFETIGFAEASRRTRLRLRPEEAGAEALYLQTVARRPPREQFLRGRSHRSFLFWKLQRSIVGAGIAGLAGCGAYAAALWLEQMSLRERIEGVRLETAHVQDQLARLSARFPATPAGIETLKASAVELRRIATRGASPEAALEHVSRALDQAPRIELDALAWSAEPEQTIEISGRVNGATRPDHREIAAEVQRFSALLAAGAKWRVLDTRLPFDLSPEGVLAVTAGADSADAPRFAVRIARIPG